MFFKKQAVALLLFLAGCANVKTDFDGKLSRAPVCCSDIANINYEALSYDKPVIRMLGGKKSRPARLFQEGKSYFAAFALPLFTSHYELEIKSSPRYDALFPPKIQLLDQNFQVKKIIDLEKFQYSNGILSHNLFVNNDQGYRYALVYSDSSKLGSKKSMRIASSSATTISSGPYLVNVYSGHDDSSEVVLSPGGRIEVLVKKYAPRTLQ